MSTINANTRGVLTVDRDSLHASDGYKRQIDALRQLQQDKPMSTEELRKAVERMDAAFTMAGVIARGDDWMLISQALRDQEAEIARLREVAELIPSNWCDPLLTGPTAVIGKPPYNCPDIERLLNGIRTRITAHLGGENNG